MRGVAGQRRGGRLVAGPSTIELLLDETRRAEDLQEGAGTALDQVAGIVTGFAGVIVTVLVGKEGWPTVTAALLAAGAAVCGVRAMAIRTTATLRPAALLERFGETERDVAELAILGTSAVLHEDRAERLHRKRNWFTVGVWLLVGAIAVLVGTVTVDGMTPDDQQKVVTSDA